MTIRSFKDYIINESKKKIADLDNFIKTYPNSTATYTVKKGNNYGTGRFKRQEYFVEIYENDKKVYEDKVFAPKADVAVMTVYKDYLEKSEK